MEDLAMGGYGAYVWSSFGLAATVVVVCAVQAYRRQQRMLRELEIRMAAAERS